MHEEARFDSKDEQCMSFSPQQRWQDCDRCSECGRMPPMSRILSDPPAAQPSITRFPKKKERFGPIVGKSSAMQQLYEDIAKVAQSHANVVILGESGTGKELVAKTIHDLSVRKNAQFVTVNCGAIPENLFESEFFGYKKGAFSGAAANKIGFLDCADGGTLFLDEVGELNLYMQTKLLRAIDGGGYTPVGGHVVKKPNIRIICATNKDLMALCENGQMRRDFFYRLYVLFVTLPPLRRRKEDLPLLIDHFSKKYSRRGSHSFSRDDLKKLLDYHWPGNVRELENTILRYLAMNKVDLLQFKSPRQVPGKTDAIDMLADMEQAANLQDLLHDVEKAYIIKTLRDNNWHRGKAARKLGLNRKTLYKKIVSYDIKP